MLPGPTGSNFTQVKNACSLALMHQRQQSNRITPFVFEPILLGLLIAAAAPLLDGGHGGKRAAAADLGALVVEEDGHGDQDGGDAAQQRAGVLDAHAVEHVGGEEGEAGAGEGAEERVGGDGGGGELADALAGISRGLRGCISGLTMRYASTR